MNTNRTAKEAVDRAKEDILVFLGKSSTPKRAKDIQLAIGLTPYNGETIDGITFHRVVDRALQALRRAGKTHFTTRGWMLNAPDRFAK